MIKKKMLFIAPTFFGYYKEIKKEIERLNFEVDYVADIPSNNNFQKAIGRINKNLIKHNVNKYFEKSVIQIIKNKKYDFVFVIVGMTFSFTKENIKKIKELNTRARFIMYQWDGEKNIKFVNEIHKYFDKIFTFDRIDALENKKYDFLPLFYTENYENVGKSNERNFVYDISYIGTAHPKKIEAINEMAKNLKDILKKQYIYHYIPSIFKFIYHKFTSKEYKNIRYKDLKHEKLSVEKTMEIFEKSKCILDAPQSGQNGLTIRTIECLGAKRKLITNNKDIINYDFYNPKNIYVYEGVIDNKNIFFKEKYENISEELYKKYSLRNWLKTIIKN